MTIAWITRGLGSLLLLSFAAVGGAQKAAVKQTGTTTARPVRSYAVVCTADPIMDETDINSSSTSSGCSINDGGGGGSDPSDSQSNSDPNASGYAPVDCSNESNATVANCYPQPAGGTSRTPVNGGGASKGGGPWQRACVQTFAQEEKTCNQKGGNVTACKSAAQAKQESCMKAAGNSAAQHNQPVTIVPDPSGASMPSTNSCQVFLAQNTAYCTGLAKTRGAPVLAACRAKVQEADNMCKSDAAKSQPASSR